ncbi:MAG TPA: hypothetical protein VFM48_08065 [Aquabacterium sp.]|nr:hypothetical protein [Aquabacterium sp.]
MTKWQVWGWSGLAVVALALPGCAAFRGEKLAKVDSTQLEVPHGATKLKVFARWTSDVLVDPVPEKALQAGAELSKKSFEDAIAASDCCTFVDQESQADLLVDGIRYIKRDNLTAAPALLTGLTLYLIPSWETTPFKVSVRAQKGMDMRVYELEDSVTTIQWLPFILAMPFADPLTVSSAVENNVYQTLVLKMKADGLLTP